MTGVQTCALPIYWAASGFAFALSEEAEGDATASLLTGAACWEASLKGATATAEARSISNANRKTRNSRRRVEKRACEIEYLNGNPRLPEAKPRAQPDWPDLQPWPATDALPPEIQLQPRLWPDSL